MNLLDTHIWIYWMNGANQLSPAQSQAIDRHATGGGIAVSPISCWEIAMLVAHRRLNLNLPTSEWISAALTHPAVTIKQLTPRVAVESTQLPDLDHRDPADRFLIATARIHEGPLLTHDQRILAYPHVQTIG